MRRVVIVGPGGVGKSTLADELGRRTGLPVVHLDQHFWHPGWVETPRDEWRAVQQRLFAGDEWIADGNYGATLDERLPRADTVVLCDPAPLRAVAGALRRTLTNRGRAVQAPGCPERLDPSFLLWVVRYRSRSRPEVIRAITELAPDADVHVLRNRRAMRAFLASSARG